MNINNPEQIIEKHIDLGNIVNIKDLKKVETQVLFTLFFIEDKFHIQELTSKYITEFINKKLRLKTSLQAVNIAITRSDDKISSIKKKGIAYHKIMPPGIQIIQALLNSPCEKEVIDIIIPNEIVSDEKHYFQKVIKQVNGCYQDKYFDACFVMVRRAVETLIINAYESKKIEKSILDSEGNYLTFSKLIDKTLTDNIIKLSKTSKTDIRKIKKFGDIAAHNRKLNLKQCDIDKYSDSIRIIIEELINNK